MKQTLKSTNERIDNLENKIDQLIALMSNGTTPKTTTKGSSSKTVKAELELTAEQKAIVKKYKPTHRLGKDKGSINQSLRSCAYEFCGGKDKYNEKDYTLGKKAWFTTYNKAFREALPETK